MPAANDISDRGSREITHGELSDRDFAVISAKRFVGGVPPEFTLELERVADLPIYYPSEIDTRAVADGEADARREELLRIVRDKHAFDPSILREEGRAPFFFPAVITNNELDTYYTRMGESSLRNYTEDATQGVSLQNSHRRDLGFGRTVLAEYDTRRKQVRAWFYTVPGMRLSEVSTDDLISGVRAGLVKAVSIGFMQGRYVCSACGNDMFKRWAECSHYPGQVVQVTTKDGKDTGRTDVVTATIEDAHLGEVSAGFKNSTPGAVISKTIRLVEQGILGEDSLLELEERFRTARTPDGAAGTSILFRSFASSQHAIIRERTPMGDTANTNTEPTAPAGTPAPETPPAPASTPSTPPAAPASDPAGSGGSGNTGEARVPSNIRQVLGAPESVSDPLAWASAELVRLRTLADEGVAYRKDITEQAMHQGRRAFGDKFQEERYAAVLSRSSVDEVKQFRDDWQAIADAATPGGRQVRDRASVPQAPKTGQDSASDDERVLTLPSAYYRD